MALFAVPDVIDGSWLGLAVRAVIVAVGVPLLFAAARLRRRTWDERVTHHQRSGHEPGSVDGAAEG